MKWTLFDVLLTIGLGVVGTLIGAALLKLVGWYVARRPIRSRTRRLRDARFQLKLLEKLASSDRTLLIFGFQMLFVLISFGSIAVIVSLLFTLRPGAPLDPNTLVNIALWFVITVLAVYALSVLKKLDDPQPPIETLRRRIEELERQDEPPKG
jgi:hypothetical protein